MKRIPLVGTSIDGTSYNATVKLVMDWSRSLESRYVCIANVHMLMEAYDSDEFRRIINTADLVTPDGMPLVWMIRLKGVRDQQRVYGPTLMMHVLEGAAKNSIPIGFYGGSPRVLESLITWIQKRYEILKIAFSFSPPYSQISPEEDAKVANQINQSGARILFVGLGCPKQEIWMAEHRGVVNAVMIGVGAAFDFHAGVKAQAPAWMQKVGLEWLFRLSVEPRRLWKRYLYHNPRFIVLAIADLLGLFNKAA
jgi:N-acetylglucosaminyldiphosphoundecaprenol N-acetyl-beta-D-mannosaminyltransferase